MVKRVIFILFLFCIALNYSYADDIYLDIDRDGFPDKAELLNSYDRLNFSTWFAYIALSQYYFPSPMWNEKERDCAGLIRFSYKEALKKHDNKWFSKMPYLISIKASDILAFNYPNVPFIGERLFRIAPGVFKYKDISHIEDFFSSYANTYHLIKFNMVKLGRKKDLAKKGDILVFFNPYDRNMPYHTMIFIGRDIFKNSKEGDDWLIYHTGPRERDNGVIKLVKESVLRHHQDPRWRPIKENPFFLGYFRFKILVNQEE